MMICRSIKSPQSVLLLKRSGISQKSDSELKIIVEFFLFLLVISSNWSVRLVSDLAFQLPDVISS